MKEIYASTGPSKVCFYAGINPPCTVSGDHFDLIQYQEVLIDGKKADPQQLMLGKDGTLTIIL
ncbi:hypothetical protein [Catenisphaera adipataccumulans]|jgi:hypothetical protein|uniref:Uncharacterized protein n=1 Tax=Catenisphaera adipataccumulans TaxID=700500 RepID=A0A7W8CWD3_9FIRM|nr:hypothetical protein [Catenisphaera adipataccumulans]MBB5182826.1 hypothetical protein [Catenisphaera adipataccumulans]